MTDLTRNIRSVSKAGNNIRATVIAVAGERATVRLSTNGAIYRTLKVSGGPVFIGQIVQVDFSSDIPYIVAIGRYTEPEATDFKALIPKYPTYVRSAVGSVEYAIILNDMSAQQLLSYSVDASGLSDAILGASAGDTIYIPPCSIGGDYTVPVGVTIIGLDRNNTILTGTITLSNESVLQNLTVNTSASGDCAAIKGPLVVDTSAELLMVTAHAMTSSGSAFGLMIQGGDVITHYSSVSGETSGSDGFGFGIGIVGAYTEHYVEGDLLSYELFTSPSVEFTEYFVERPEVPITVMGGPNTYCLLKDLDIEGWGNGKVAYDLGATYHIEHWMHYKMTEGTCLIWYSLDGVNWTAAGSETLSWSMTGWGYGEMLGSATNFDARYLMYEINSIPMVGEQVKLGYFELLDSYATWYSWDNTGSSEVCWSHVHGTTKDLYSGIYDISVYAAQYDTYRTYGNIILLDGDVRRQISATTMNLSLQVPSPTGHYDVDYPINDENIYLYKNGLRQSPNTYIIDADGLGFTILFDVLEGDEIVVDYTQISYTLPENTAIFYIDNEIDTGLVPFRIYNTTSRIKYISKVFVSTGSYSTSGNVYVDIHKNGTTIFTNQANRPMVWAYDYSGYTEEIDVPLWNPGEYLQMAIDSAGTNTGNVSVHIVYN